MVRPAMKSACRAALLRSAQVGSYDIIDSRYAHHEEKLPAAAATAMMLAGGQTAAEVGGLGCGTLGSCTVPSSFSFARQRTNTELHWHQYSGRCLCNSMLQRSSSYTKLSRAAAAEAISMSTPVSTSNLEVLFAAAASVSDFRLVFCITLGPATTLATRTSQARCLASVARQSLSTPWSESVSTKAFMRRLKLRVNASSCSSRAGGSSWQSRWCGTSRRINSMCWSGSVKNHNQTILGSTRKSSTSHSSNIVANEGMNRREVWMAPMTSQTAFSRGAGSMKRLASSQLSVHVLICETSPSLLHRCGCTESIELDTSWM
mmetsp:Transcript_565/g.1703  ORF Transcript_565/g.1703 Transcript_565/m.1703 type:complete len:318 (-) Transcript_565:983-1936(-)